MSPRSRKSAAQAEPACGRPVISSSLTPDSRLPGGTSLASLARQPARQRSALSCGLQPHHASQPPPHSPPPRRQEPPRARNKELAALARHFWAAAREFPSPLAREIPGPRPSVRGCRIPHRSRGKEIPQPRPPRPALPASRENAGPSPSYFLVARGCECSRELLAR